MHFIKITSEASSFVEKTKESLDAIIAKGLEVDIMNHDTTAQATSTTE